MNVNVARLKGKVVEKGMNGEMLSDALGIDQSTYYRKLKDAGKNFTVNQVFTIVKTLSLTKEEAIDIFFSQ